MDNLNKKHTIISAILVFIVVPVLIYTFGDFPRRSVLKEAISLLTILAFSMMLAQFFLGRSNRVITKVHKMKNVLRIHKFIGYFFVSILLCHPFLIVLPRYFESGVTPLDALKTILHSYGNFRLMLGMIAWVLMLFLGITSAFRHKLGLKYKSWRKFHGILSIVFISLATWHAVGLGRHTNLTMSVYMIFLAVIGILLLLKLYIFKTSKPAEIQ